jgi:hypothetical protein
LVFQMQPGLAVVPSLIPSSTMISLRRATSATRRTSGPGTMTALASSFSKNLWFEIGGRSEPQRGKAGTYVSGKTTSFAPLEAASSISEHALSMVFAVSRNTGLTCMAATLNFGYVLN